ncbi:PPW family C-terminal domain-containing PPE protein [Mycobacterium avium subsp. paratuberculosis]|uniref:PPW family C-terminal domain-containing PPE protein n=2 Tax=Mycobacterium avium TaxID=1764 RepID=UPI00385785B0
MGAGSHHHEHVSGRLDNRRCFRAAGHGGPEDHERRHERWLRDERRQSVRHGNRTAAKPSGMAGSPVSVQPVFAAGLVDASEPVDVLVPGGDLDSDVRAQPRATARDHRHARTSVRDPPNPVPDLADSLQPGRAAELFPEQSGVHPRADHTLADRARGSGRRLGGPDRPGGGPGAHADPTGVTVRDSGDRRSPAADRRRRTDHGHGVVARRGSDARITGDGGPPGAPPTPPPTIIGPETSFTAQAFVSPYLVGVLGAATESSVSGKNCRPAADATAAAAAAPGPTAADRQTRRRLRNAPSRVDRGYRYEFLDPEADTEPDERAAADVAPQPNSSLTSERGAGRLAVTTVTGRRASGLARLAGDAFGGAPTVPMMPGSWTPATG